MTAINLGWVRIETGLLRDVEYRSRDGRYSIKVWSLMARLTENGIVRADRCSLETCKKFAEALAMV